MSRLVLTILMIVYGCSAFAQSPATMGTWTGTAAQNVGKSGYTVILTITRDGGKSDYPELKCGGTLSRIASSHGYDFFIEKITRGGINSGGSCIDGTVTVAPAGNGLAWGWIGSFKNQVFVAWSNLARK